jgi:hypothetical protein
MSTVLCQTFSSKFYHNLFFFYFKKLTFKNKHCLGELVINDDKTYLLVMGTHNHATIRPLVSIDSEVNCSGKTS